MKAAAVKAQAKPVQIPAATIDDYGDVVKLRDAFAPTERLYQRLYGQLKALVEDADPAAEFIVTGARYTLRISPRGFESKPDIPQVRRRLGAAAFLAIASVTKKALEQFMLRPEIDAICVETQTGSRSFAPIPIVIVPGDRFDSRTERRDNES